MIVNKWYTLGLAPNNLKHPKFEGFLHYISDPKVEDDVVFYGMDFGSDRESMAIDFVQEMLKDAGLNYQVNLKSEDIQPYPRGYNLKLVKQ